MEPITFHTFQKQLPDKVTAARDQKACSEVGNDFIGAAMQC